MIVLSVKIPALICPAQGDGRDLLGAGGPGFLAREPCVLNDGQSPLGPQASADQQFADEPAGESEDCRRQHDHPGKEERRANATAQA